MTVMTNTTHTSEEQRAIDACDHRRATVEDRDDLWSRDGERVIGKQELIVCPDCPLGGSEGEWFPVDTPKEDA